MTAKILTTNEPLTFRQALAVLSDVTVSYGAFEEETCLFVAKGPYKKPLPTSEEICTTISARNVESLKKSILRAERQDRKGERHHKEKMKSWGLNQRRGLLSGKIRYQSDQLTVKERYESFYTGIQTLNYPFVVGTRGPAQRYDRNALATGIALKYLLDVPWSRLPAQLRGCNVDLRQDMGKITNAAEVPSHTTFMKLVLQVPEEDLRAWLRQLDDWARTQWGQWTATSEPVVYATDGTGHPLQCDEVISDADECHYRRKTLHCVLTQNLVTLTIREVHYPELEHLSRRDLANVLQHLPLNATLLTDCEFDVEYVYAAAQTAHINVVIRPNQPANTTAATPLRRQAHQTFNATLYRQRKREESINGTFVKRGVFQPRQQHAITASLTTFWASVGHDLQCLLRLKIYQRIYRWVSVELPSLHISMTSDRSTQFLTAAQPLNRLTDDWSLPLLDRVLSCLKNVHTAEQGLTSPELQRRLGVPRGILHKELCRLLEERVIGQSIIYNTAGKKLRSVYYLATTLALGFPVPSLYPVPPRESVQSQTDTNTQILRSESQTPENSVNQQSTPVPTTNKSPQSFVPPHHKKSLPSSAYKTINLRKLSPQNLVTLMVTVFSSLHQVAYEFTTEQLASYFCLRKSDFKKILVELEGCSILQCRRLYTRKNRLRAEYWCLVRPPEPPPVTP